MTHYHRSPRGLTIKRVDENHAEILNAARQIGLHVVDTHIIGQGVPDCIVIRPSDSRSWLVEIKTATGDLTEPEKEYALKSRVKVHIVRSVDDLLTLLDVSH